MKKIVAFALLLVLAINLASCATTPTVSQTDFSTTVSTTVSTSTKVTVQTTKPLPVYVSGSIKLDPGEDWCDEDAAYFKRHFRVTYYRMPGTLGDLAGEDGYRFLEELAINADGKELSEMCMVSYIKRFQIPRETFEKTIEEWKDFCLSMGHDLTAEEFELPNADIIYTFDNEIINEYYRRE
jgi:hypothetical protein